MSTITGAIGGLIGLIAAVITGAVTITVVVILFMSPGAITGLIDLAGSLIGLAASAIAGFFGFLGDLLSFATS